MARNNFNYLLKQVVEEFHGNEKEVRTVGGYSLSEEKRIILRMLKELVMNTNYFKEDTKIFLFSRYGTNINYNNSNGCSSNKNTSRSRINYDLLKLKSVLGGDALEIIIKSQNKDLSYYAERINDLIMKTKGKIFLEGFSIKVPECYIESKELSQEEIENLKEIVKYGSKKYLRLLEKRMTINQVAYLRYLEKNKDNLSGREKELHAYLMEWIV